MAWMKMLSDTYDAYADLVGKEENDQPVLLPIYHSTVNAQIELALDEDGNIIPELCRLIDKKEEGVATIIPVMQATRSNGSKPNPLVDKLCYLAGDYSQYTKDDKTEYYQQYMEGLKEWVESPFTHKAIQAIYKYLAKGCLIRDLLSMGLLQLDEDGILSDKVNKLQGQEQTGAVVRFCVGNGVGKYIWKSQELYQLFIAFYQARIKEKELCYVTGEQTACSDKHPSKVRNSGDMAKLISGNDKSGFTYRGRFQNKEQAVRIGYETSQKAHNALRWLLQKQGYTRDDAAIVAWEVHGKPIPGLICDTVHALLSSEDEEEDIGYYDEEIGYEDSEVNYSTGEYYAKKLKNAMNGYAVQFTEKDQVILMALDAATTGRMSITYYHEMAGNQFIRQVQQWHERCAWVRKVEVKKGKKVWVECAPSPREMALAAFGVERNKNGYLEADKKLLRSTVERILPCIVSENKKIPLDIMRAAVNRASKPEAFTSFLWENQVLRVACAIIKYNCFGGEKMKLDDETMLYDRNFLFGRLLAVLDVTEARAMYGEKEKERLTNAKRYWNAYSRRPARTYATIKRQVMPYLKRLNNAQIAYFDSITQEIMCLMETEDFNDAALNELYLPGYYCQREEIRRYKGKNESENSGGSENE